MRPPSTAIQPFSHAPISSELTETVEVDNVHPFINFADFTTQGGIELPLKITVPIPDGDHQGYGNLENLSRSLDFLSHIPPIYFKSRHEGSAKGGFMASFGAHATLHDGNPIVPITGTVDTFKRKTLGYSTNRFSVGYVHHLREWKRYTWGLDPGTLFSWIHWDVSNSRGSQVF